MLSAVNWVVRMAEMTIGPTDEVRDDLWADQKASEMAVKMVGTFGVKMVVDLVD